MKGLEEIVAGNMPAAAAPPVGRYLELAPSQIRRSPTNPRKTFGDDLHDLAASIAEKGVIVPILVRPTPATAEAKEPYELVAGERRWRAARMAKTSAIPAIVRELSDQEVLEIQLVENLQRVDVHPLEEADGYEELLEHYGYDVEGIAAKTGKSASYIYARLKLGALAAGPRVEFLHGRLSASVALLIARVPDVDLQERATREVLGERDALEPFQDVDPSDPAAPDRRELRAPDDYRDVDVDVPGTAGAAEALPMSFREAQIHLRRRYMLRLELATFELADTKLVPKAGACTTCSYRTGNQRELFAEVSSADVCTNPPCFEAKTRSAWEAKAAAAQAAGLKVVEKAKTERMFASVDGRTVSGTSPYVDPKDQVPRDLVPMGAKAPTWEKLLGKKIDAPMVLVQDQTGAARELIDKAAAVKLLRAAGKIDKPERPRAGAGTDWKAQSARHEQERNIRERAHQQLVRAGLDKLAGTVDAKKELAQWKWIVRVVAQDLPELAQELLGVKEPEDLERKVDGAVRARVYLFGALFAEFAESVWSAPREHSPLLAAVKLLGLDYEKAMAEAEAAVEVAQVAEQKVDESKAAKANAKAKAKKGAKKR